MAYMGHEVDDYYADEDGQHFIKLYIDFENAEESYAFAEWAEDNWWRFQAVIDEFEHAREESQEEA